MGFSSLAYDLMKAHPRLRLTLRRGLRTAKAAGYHLRTAGTTPDPHTILFCSYHGKSAACSPRAIYDRLLTLPEYRDFQFVWAVEHPERFSELAESPRTTLVPFGSAAFERAMAGAKYWIFNITLPEHITPRQDQVYLQCWHGTPLKRLGFDIAETDNAMNSIAEIHRKYRLEGEKVDYFLSPSPFASACFRSAWQLERWGKGDAILEVGYPRNDALVNPPPDAGEAVRRRLGIPQGKRVLLYAPTFRDDQHISGSGYAYTPAVDFTALRQTLGEEYVILFRAHYLVASHFDFAAYEGFVMDVSGVEQINDLYLAADLMLTDYSSTMFDFAVLRRSILFYMYDLEQYRDHLRGFYFDLNQLPGPILTRPEQLIPAIRDSEHFVWDQRWEAFRNRFAPLEDGNAALRVIQTVIQEEPS